MKNKTYLFLILLGVLASCQNRDWEFPDFEYQTVYFSTQFPVRTITLGEDIFDTSLDNEGKFRILATTAGVYENEADVEIGFEIDNSLVDGMAFSGSGNDIIAMPGSHYSLSSDRIVIPKGQLIGGVEVQLTDAFFADPLAVSNNYVIPVRMTEVTNADSILSGISGSDTGRRGIANDWAVQPKDFTFYAVKYVNPWHGYYLRRGRDVIVGKSGYEALSGTFVRRNEFVERDQVIMLPTQSFNSIHMPLIFQDEDEENIREVNLILNVAEDGSITVQAGSGEYTASGSGRFVKKGEKNSWGGMDRDAIYLNYEIDFDELSVTSIDTLVLRNRGVGMETFTPNLK